MKRIGIAFLYFIYILFLLGVLFIIIYNSNRKNDETPRLFHYETFIVTSSSMEKTLKPFDFIVALKTDELFVGDIIVFRKNNQTTTHRIVALVIENDETKYVTKGDNNSTNDIESVSQDEVLGKVVFTIPYIGRFINYMHTPTGILACLVIPSFILFLFYFQRVISDIKEMKNK